MKIATITGLVGFLVMVSYQSSAFADTTPYIVPGTDVSFTITTSTSPSGWFATNCHVGVAMTGGSGWIKHIQSVCAWAAVNQGYTQGQRLTNKTVTSSAAGWFHKVRGYARVCSAVDSAKCISVDVKFAGGF